MSLGVRGRLFVVSVALILVVGLTSGAYLENQLRRLLVSRIEAELHRHALTVRELFWSHSDWSTPAAVDPLADRLGQATGARVTVIAQDGTVLGDSALTIEQVRQLDNHGRRPEVVAALSDGRGVTRRFSATLRTDMLYVAVPLARADAVAVVRTATPLDEIEPVVNQLRVLLGVAGLLGLAIAVFMSGLASYFLSRTLRSLVQHASAMAAGARRQRIAVATTDEIGGLAGSLNRMAEDLEHAVTTLATERDRFAAVLEGLADAILALDAEQRITLANRAALTLLDLPEPPLGRTLLETIRAPVLQDLVVQAQRGTPSTAEFDLPITRVAQARRVLASATPQPGTGGSVVVLHDVTELRRLETMRRDLVANVSHELRTPVSVIRGNAETLLLTPLGDAAETREFLEALLRQADRLARIVADLLELAQIESDQYPLHLEPVLIAPAVQRALEVVDQDRQAKGLSLDLAVAPDLSAQADANALDQIILNLLDNAVKYMLTGGHLSIRGSVEAGHVRIEVGDDGPGIAPQHRDRIFERFYRVDTGRSREQGGTGLGLAIVKHLALAMHGEVGVEAATPRGSIFWITLPLPAAGRAQSPPRPDG